MSPSMDEDELIRRLAADLEDSYDEELEMEIEDRHPLPAGVPVADADQPGSERSRYFRELFRLQGELVKLQDWIVDARQKVVILFEGRARAKAAPSSASRSA
jgi:polyphosphate kinase 2 (PPK2 family)